jgi:hypothetical protein
MYGLEGVVRPRATDASGELAGGDGTEVLAGRAGAAEGAASGGGGAGGGGALTTIGAMPNSVCFGFAVTGATAGSGAVVAAAGGAGGGEAAGAKG